MYKIMLFRLDGRFDKPFESLAEAVIAFREIEDLKDDKRICMVLCGPEVWIESYKEGK